MANPYARGADPLKAAYEAGDFLQGSIDPSAERGYAAIDLADHMRDAGIAVSDETVALILGADSNETISSGPTGRG